MKSLVGGVYRTILGLKIARFCRFLKRHNGHTDGRTHPLIEMDASKNQGQRPHASSATRRERCEPGGARSEHASARMLAASRIENLSLGHNCTIIES